MRTQDEILQRFKVLHGAPDDARGSLDDLFGFRQEALLESMTLETAERTGLLKEDFDRSKWTDPDVESTAREYLLFAIGKAVNHRGLSAGRSIEKLGEWLWVLGDEALLERFELAPYAQYGAPKLALLVEEWGMQLYAEDKLTEELFDVDSWQRMVRSEPCHPGCNRGCGA